MTPIVRIFESEAAAQDAAAQLTEAGHGRNRVLTLRSVAAPATAAPTGEAEAPTVPATTAPDAEAMVRAAVDEGLLAVRHVRVCIDNLERGRSLVAAAINFGFGQYAIDIMERCGAVDSHTLPAYYPRDPSPLSDLLGIPTLTKAAPWTELKSSSWHLSSLVGLGLLSRKAAPLSSLFGMKTLTTRKREWRTSMGLPLLSSNPAPLSSMLKMSTVTSRKGPDRVRLSRNPAPLSSLLGLATLVRHNK